MKGKEKAGRKYRNDNRENEGVGGGEAKLKEKGGERKREGGGGGN